MDLEKEFDSISFRPPLQQIVDPFVYSGEALPSRVMILHQVMDALKGPDLNMIGVYGMGGIGKTTLAKEVYRKAVEEELFSFVIMVTVSHTPDLRRIQSEIANFLGLEFDVEDVPTARASRLCKRLKYSKVLIILDDIWDGFDLRSVGIPLGNELKRSKILLTSRRMDVLYSEMGTQKDFSLEVLDEDEARSLFEMTMGEAKDPELRAIANEVVERCAGLPLLVVIVATYLKNRELSAWRDTLQKLFDFGNEEFHGKVHKVLKSIYNESLPSNEVKSFFLLCVLSEGPNISVNHLLTYAMGLDLFGNIIRLKDARERLFQMIEKLKTESLLLDGDMNGYVKMHDVVLDVARSIATEEQHAFYGVSGHWLREWPRRDCTRFAFTYKNINELPQGVEYTKAELFSLFSKDLYLGIPDLFFEGFKELKVLNLTGMHFMSLPTSFHFLKNVHSLHLVGCQLDDVAIIGELKQLEFLSLADSYIVELPKQIERLSQLKLLDVTNCTQLKIFPANVLSKLSLLEELLMGNSFIKWDVEGNISVMELEELRYLTTLEIQLIDAKKMPNRLFFRGLQRYIIFIGDRWAWDETYEASKTLKLRLKKVIHKEDGLKELLRETQALYIDDVIGIKNLLYDLDGECCQQLKYLHIRNVNVIPHIINSTMSASCRAFPILETLALDNLKSLEVIYYGQIKNGYFSKLRILKISRCYRLRDLFSPQPESICCKMDIFSNLTSLIVRECGSLKYIFRSSTITCLLQLKRLVIECCDFMEYIMLTEERINKIVFPNLDFLGLIDLPNLKEFSNDCSIEFRSLRKLEIKECHKLKNFVSNISNRDDNCDIQSLFNDMVTFPNLQIMRVSKMENLVHIWDQLIVDSFCKLKSLKISSCMNLLAVFSSNVVKRFQRLEELYLSWCPKIEGIYQLWDLISDEMAASELGHLELHCFPTLKYLTVESCASLKNIDASSSISFRNLTALHLAYCDKLENLITTSTAKTMAHLMELRITYCEVMKEIVANNGDDPKHEIIFNLLKCLELQYLPTLYSFCSGNYIFHFPLLEEVVVEDCLRMKIFCGGVLSTPKLRGVRHFKYEGEVQYWDGNLNETIASQCCREKVLQNAYKWYVIEDPSFSRAILANQLQFLNNLRKINVRDCDSVQVVFDLENVSVEHEHAGLLPELEELQLTNLPKLSELWNKDPVRLFDFRKLRLLKVQNCNSLKYAFTQSVASSLFELQKIEVENCKMMEAIIKEEEAKETKLPSLKKISIKGCPSMKFFIFPSREQNPRPDEEGIREQIIGTEEHNEIVMPRLEELRIDWNIIKHKLDDNSQPAFFTRLKVIELVFPSNSFAAMEKLVLNDALVEELIINGMGNNHELLPRLKKIILSKLPNLKSIVYDDDPRRVSYNLQVLQVWECSSLRTLVSSFVHFQNLTFLQVSKCDGLINLTTVSTTKSLVQLRKMYVGRCKMIQEIVAVEFDGEEDEIGFPQLEYLVFDDLPCLTSFCSNKNTFDFPCLEELFIIKCPKMKMFAQAINSPKLSQVQTGGKEYEWEWEDNLNSTIQALSMERSWDSAGMDCLEDM